METNRLIGTLQGVSIKQVHVLVSQIVQITHIVFSNARRAFTAFRIAIVKRKGRAQQRDRGEAFFMKWP